MRSRATRLVPLVMLGSMLVQMLFICPLHAEMTEAQLIEALGSKDRGTRQFAKEVFLAQGDKAIPILLKLLDDPDVGRKATAILTLGELKAKEAVPRLIAELKNANIVIAINSALSLGLIGDGRALPPLTAMLDPPSDYFVRGAALIALGYLRNAEAIPRVRELLKEQDQSLRIAAATTLGMLGSSDGLQEALAGTTSDSGSVQLTSIQALGVIGDKQALARLEEMAQDPKRLWKSDILLSIKQIECANSESKYQIDVLRACIKDKNTKIVEWAIMTLAGLATPEAVSLLDEKANADSSKEAGLARARLRTIRK